jgi:uncharacterized protein (TIGR00369 family)
VTEKIQEPADAALAERVSRGFVHGVPHNAALGLELLDCSSGRSTVRLPYRKELVGDDETGVLHGGVVTALLDATCGAAVFLRLREPCRIATLDLRIDYLRPGKPGEDLLARADCYKVTRRIAFVRAQAYHDDESNLVAAAAGTFMLFPGDDPSPLPEESG